MNWGLGFRRLYAVAGLAWIIFAFWWAPSNRIRFWIDDFSYGQPHKGVIDSNGAKWETIEDFQPPPLWSKDTVPETIPHKILWLLGTSLLPPAVGYGILFYVIPWIYRGFKPGTHF